MSGRPPQSYQAQPLQARVSVLADDNVIGPTMPSGLVISTIALVISMSVCDGVGSRTSLSAVILQLAAKVRFSQVLMTSRSRG
jgi:hypothetical protein